MSKNITLPTSSSHQLLFRLLLLFSWFIFLVEWMFSKLVRDYRTKFVQNSKLCRTRRWHYLSLATRKTAMDGIKMSEFRPHVRCEYNEIIVLVPKTKFYYCIIFFSVECEKVAVSQKHHVRLMRRFTGRYLYLEAPSHTHTEPNWPEAYLCRCSRTRERRSWYSLFMPEILIFFMSPSSSPFNGFMFALLSAVASLV